MSMFHSVPGVPRRKMERFAGTRMILKNKKMYKKPRIFAFLYTFNVFYNLPVLEGTAFDIKLKLWVWSPI